MAKPQRYGERWERDELVLALYLYCQIPFAKTKANNPEVIRLARLLERTPAAVARKLGNFGAFDPLLAEQGISGLAHYSKADKATWDEFNENWGSLVKESQRLLRQKRAEEPSASEQEEAPIVSRPTGPTERQATVSVRIGQDFFRRTVTSSYEHTCCVCGLDLPALLIGSHIVPWSVSEKHRTDPQNGLCLCTLHDSAFDKGMISVSADFEIMVSSEVSASDSDFVETAIENFHRQEITLPRRFAPCAEYLEWHVENVFRG